MFGSSVLFWFHCRKLHSFIVTRIAMCSLSVVFLFICEGLQMLTRTSVHPIACIPAVAVSNWPGIFGALSREAMKSIAAIASQVLDHLDQKGKVMAEYIWLGGASSTGGFDMRGKTMSMCTA